MGKVRGVVFFILFLVVIVVVYLLIGNRSLEGTKVMEPKFDTSLTRSKFLLETVKGKKIEIEAEDGIFKIKGMEEKTVFLKVFGWDCKFCKKEIPELVALKKQLGDAFEIVAVEAQHFSKEESLAYMKKYGINYHIVLGASQSEFYAYLQNRYGWTGIIPLTIVVSQGGRVLAFEIGAKSYSLSELMQAALLRE